MSYSIFANTQSMPYEDWLDCRRQGIGGSDAAVVCGVSRYKSPVGTLMEKTGQLPAQEAGEAAYWGNQLEAWCGLSLPNVPVSRWNTGWSFCAATSTPSCRPTWTALVCTLILALAFLRPRPPPLSRPGEWGEWHPGRIPVADSALHGGDRLWWLLHCRPDRRQHLPLEVHRAGR